MKHMKQKQRTPPAPLSPTHETETQPQAFRPPGRNFQPLHERKRSRRERGALKISAAVAAPAPEHEGADARDLRLAIHLPGLLDTLLLHSPACVCACDTRPLWVRLGYLAYAGRPGSDGVSHNLRIGIQCEIVART